MVDTLYLILGKFLRVNILATQKLPLSIHLVWWQQTKILFLLFLFQVQVHMTQAITSKETIFFLQLRTKEQEDLEKQSECTLEPLPFVPLAQEHIDLQVTLVM